MREYIAFTDGGREPGTETVLLGGIIYYGGEVILTYSEKGPKGGNNDAEFLSLIKCLELALEKGIYEITINVDAKILVDSLTEITERIEELITKLHSSEGGAKIGIVKALSKITKQRLGVNPSAWENWYYKNKDRLENMDISNNNQKYIQKLEELQKQINFKLILIPRNENIAHKLCEGA